MPFGRVKSVAYHSPVAFYFELAESSVTLIQVLQLMVYLQYMITGSLGVAAAVTKSRYTVRTFIFDSIRRFHRNFHVYIGSLYSA